MAAFWLIAALAGGWMPSTGPGQPTVAVIHPVPGQTSLVVASGPVKRALKRPPGEWTAWQGERSIRCTVDRRGKRVRLDVVWGPDEPVVIRPGLPGRGACQTVRERRAATVNASVLAVKAWTLDESNGRTPGWASRLHGVQWLAIAPEAWRSTLEPLRRHREVSGLRTAVVSIEGILAGVPGGSPTFRLQRFVDAAAKATSGSLRYVFLVGDSAPERAPKAAEAARFDGALVPTGYGDKLDYGRGRLNESFPADRLLLPSELREVVHVGRAPMRSKAEMSRYVSRVLDYERAGPGEWQRRVMVWTGPARYGAFADGIIETLGRTLLDELLPYRWDLSFLFAKQDHTYAWPAPELSQRLVSELNRGALFTAYIGHGLSTAFDRVRWRGRRYDIGGVRDLDGLAVRSGAPVFVSLACLTGAFDRRRASIAETMIRGDGPVAVFAGSRVVHPYANALYAKAMMETFLTEEAATVGVGFSALRRCAANYRMPLAELTLSIDGTKLLEEHAGLYNLFGDPAMPLRYPARVSVAVREGAKPATDSSSGWAVAPGQTVTLDLSTGTSGAGQVWVELRTRRSKIRGDLVPFERLQALEEEEARRLMKANYKIATNNLVWRRRVPIEAGRAAVSFGAPAESGQYAVTVFSTTGRNAAAGAWRFEVRR